MHLDVSEEFLASILQAGPKKINHIVDDEEAVMIALAHIDCYRWVLLVIALYVQLLLLVQLASIDDGSDIWIALAEQGEGGFVDIVVNEDDGLLGLFDKVDYLYVGVEYLAIVEDSFHWWQGGANEEIDFLF